MYRIFFHPGNPVHPDNPDSDNFAFGLFKGANDGTLGTRVWEKDYGPFRSRSPVETMPLDMS